MDEDLGFEMSNIEANEELEKEISETIISTEEETFGNEDNLNIDDI